MSIVYIPWKRVREQDPNWSEICAKVVERFGLPGDRYTSHPNEDYMLFDFKNEQDSLMCKMLLSEYVEEQNRWTLTVDQDGVLTFPPEVIAKAGWGEGDTINWEDNGDGSFTLTKKIV